MFVLPQLSDTEHEALPTFEANLPQTGIDTSIKPETPFNLQLDTKGPTRLGPGLGSAAVSAGAPPPVDTVGPPSAVSPGRDISLIGNQTLPLDETIYSTSLHILSDSKEVKQTTQAGTTIY